MTLPKKILVPTDFDGAASAALDYAVDLAKATGADIVLLHAFEIPFVGLPDGVVTATPQMTAELTHATQRALDTEAARHRDGRVHVRTLLRTGNPRDEILAAANDVHADLVVMGTHARKGIERALLGSVAESVLRASRVPVLTVH